MLWSQQKSCAIKLCQRLPTAFFHSGGSCGRETATAKILSQCSFDKPNNWKQWRCCSVNAVGSTQVGSKIYHISPTSSQGGPNRYHPYFFLHIQYCLKIDGFQNIRHNFLFHIHSAIKSSLLATCKIYLQHCSSASTANFSISENLKFSMQAWVLFRSSKHLHCSMTQLSFPDLSRLP